MAKVINYADTRVGHSQGAAASDTSKKKGDLRPEIDEMLKKKGGGAMGVSTTRSTAISEFKTEPGQRARQP